MRPYLDFVRSLARRRAVRAAAGLLVVLGVASGSLPLFDAPGYELGEVGALVAALALAPWLGIAAAREARARDAGPVAATAAAATVAVGLLALGLAGALVRASVGPCRTFAAVGFLPVLALPAALLGSALATAAGFATGGRRLAAALLYAAAATASLGLALLRAWAGPATFITSPLLGAWPGPIYDEALRVDARLLLGAALASGAALLVAGLAGVVFDPRFRRGRGRGGVALAAALAAAGLATAVAARATLAARALDGDRAGIARALGGRLEGPRCTLVLPAEKPAAAARALLAECEFHAADLARLMGLADAPRATVYVHRNDADKRRLVGASGVDFTKPWLAEIHVSDAPAPHPTLRHELVHALAGAWAGGPFHVPARGGVLVSMGLVEGLAVALELPRGNWTVHEWSRAARDQGFLPDLARILGPAGFWSQAPARAYTAAGSFLAFLLERHGPGRVAQAYRTGDLAGAFGEPLPALVAAWQARLDAVPVPDGLRLAAHARFSRPGMFARTCARDLAALEASAADAAGAGRTLEACALWDDVARRTGSAWALKAKGDVLARAGDLDGALAAYREAGVTVADAGSVDGALRAALDAALGDLAWRRDDVAAAVAHYYQVLATKPDRAEVRLLSAKLTALADPVLEAEARPLLLGLEPAAAALARVEKVDHPLAAYLVGRQAWARGEFAAAAGWLARAAALRGAASAPLALEAALLLGESRCQAGESEAGAEILRERLAASPSAADRARVEAALRRCALPAPVPAPPGQPAPLAR